MQKDGSYNGLREFLGESLSPTDSVFITFLIAFGGYFFYQYYGVISLIVPVVVFTVITIEVVLWYFRNFNIVTLGANTATTLRNEEVHSPSLFEQAKDDWKVVVGLLGSIVGWFVLLGTVSATPGGPPSSVSITQQLLLEVSITARALVALGIFIASVDVFLANMTTAKSNTDK